MDVRDAGDRGAGRLSGSGYLEGPPPPALAGIARCQWRQWTDTDRVQRVVTDGCVDVMVRRGRSGPGVLVAGPMTTVALAPLTAGDRLEAVRFGPEAAGAVLGPALGLLRDETVALDDVDGWGGISDRVGAHGPGGLDRLAAACRHRLGRSDTRPDASVAALASGFRAGRWRSVAEAAEALGYSERQLRRRCVAASGLSPKQLHRIERLRAMLDRSAAARWADLAELAHAGGYADHAHLAHDSAALAGLPPGDLVAWWSR